MSQDQTWRGAGGGEFTLRHFSWVCFVIGLCMCIATSRTGLLGFFFMAAIQLLALSSSWWKGKHFVLFRTFGAFSVYGSVFGNIFQNSWDIISALIFWENVDSQQRIITGIILSPFALMLFFAVKALFMRPLEHEVNMLFPEQKWNIPLRRLI